MGSYIVYYDGQPVIIDVGRGTYTAKTFSSKRYDIWYNCSDFHNLPDVNGTTQLPGSNFKANNVAYKKDKNYSMLSLDIARAYPEKAGINSWQRSIRLNRKKSVAVTDVFALAEAGKFTEHMMTCYPAEISRPGELLIHFKPKYGVAARDFVVQFNPKQFAVSVEKVPLTAMEDKGIMDKWGDTIYRINFTSISSTAHDKVNFVIAAK